MLPQVQEPEYVEFYTERGSKGDFLILDNGAYEGEVDINNLIQMITVYQPRVCALPDYLLQDWRKTFEASIRFLDEWYERFPDVKWMYVPQTIPGDVMGLIEGLVKILDQEPRVSWIGLPRALSTKVSADPLLRVNTCKWIRRRSRHKVHALGMRAGSVAEMTLLREAGCYSIDSSAPVWRGWKGYAINDPLWPDYPVDFSAGTSFELVSDELILKNLEECGVDTTNARTRDNTRR